MNFFPGLVDDGVLRAGPFEFSPVPGNGSFQDREARGGNPARARAGRIRKARGRLRGGAGARGRRQRDLRAPGRERGRSRGAGGRRDVRPEVGTTVWLSAAADHAYFFDAATGEGLG